MAEVVHVEQRDALHVAGVGLDVAGHRHVDDQQLAAVAFGHHCFEIAAADDRFGRPGGCQQDVRLEQLVTERPEIDRSAANTTGERGGAGPAAVGDDYRAGVGGIGQGDGHPLTHSSCTQHDDLTTGEPAETVGGHGHCGGRHRRHPTGDARAGAGTPAGGDRATEERAELGAGGAGFNREVGRSSDLAEDLGLADDGGLEPAGEAEEVTGGVVAVELHDVESHVCQGDTAHGSQGLAHVSDGRVELLGDGKDLGALAGRDHDHLAHAAAPTQLDQQLGPRRRRPGRPARAAGAERSCGSDRRGRETRVE